MVIFEIVSLTSISVLWWASKNSRSKWGNFQRSFWGKYGSTDVCRSPSLRHLSCLVDSIAFGCIVYSAWSLFKFFSMSLSDCDFYCRTSPLTHACALFTSTEASNCICDYKCSDQVKQLKHDLKILANVAHGWTYCRIQGSNVEKSNMQSCLRASCKAAVCL